MKNVGILGVGSYLPPGIRTNDWWPKHIVENWSKKIEALLAKGPEEQGIPLTAGVEAAVAGLRMCVDDPFMGVTERRVVPEGMTSSEMETGAAEAAIANAGIDRQQIGVLFVHSMVPDYHTFNQAAPLHHALGLSESCLSTGIDAVCNSFATQLSIASAVVKSGDAKYALLVQSCPVSRITDYTDWYSAFQGDAATAIILGAVSEGRGLVGVSHTIESRNHRGIITGIQNQQWYENGRNLAFMGDKDAARRMFFSAPQVGQRALQNVLKKTGHSANEIDFLACHPAPGLGNLRKDVQTLVGLEHTRFVDTANWSGAVSSANCPLQFDCAQREGLLRDDDLVAMFCMGAGSTGSAAILRWGR